jgi:hypothetical protein
MQKDKNVLKAGVILPDGQITQKSVQPIAQKYCARLVGQISDLNPRVSRQTRGGSRSSRTCGEMRWTRSARQTNAHDAYGEVVWS